MSASAIEQADHPRFNFGDDPDLPGWKRWELTDTSLFNSVIGPLSTRIDGKICRVRFTPQHKHANLRGDVHGGALLAFMDMALFAAGRSFNVLSVGTAATLDLSSQFIGGAPVTQGPVEAQMELLRETGRFLFLRGLVMQGDAVIANFSGTVRKPSS